MPEGITRRGDSWRARYRNPETGRQHERSFPKQADAVRWRRQQLDALDRERWVDPEAGKVSFLRYFEAWEPDQLWTDGTRAAMSLAARSTTFADVDLRRVRPSHVEAWVKFHDRPHPGSTPIARAGHDQDPLRQRALRVPSRGAGRDDRGRSHGFSPPPPPAQDAAGGCQ